MTYLRSSFCWPFILAIVVFGPRCSQAAKQLRWKAAGGDKFQVAMTQEMKQIITVSDRTIEVPQTMAISMTWTIEEVDDDGTIHMTQAIDRITMTTQVPGAGLVTFDSATEQEQEGFAKMLSEMIRPMVGAKFMQRMNDRGKILDLQVPEEALKGMTANPLLKQFLSDKSFKQMMTQSSPVLPEQAIDKGFRWQSNSKNETPMGNMTIDVAYQYEGEEERRGRLLDKFSANVKLGFEDVAGPLGAQVKITHQDNTGSLYFDTAGGHFAESEMTQKVTMEVKLGENALDQKIETKVTLVVQRVEGKQ